MAGSLAQIYTEVLHSNGQPLDPGYTPVGYLVLIARAQSHGSPWFSLSCRHTGRGKKQGSAEQKQRRQKGSFGGFCVTPWQCSVILAMSTGSGSIHDRGSRMEDTLIEDRKGRKPDHPTAQRVPEERVVNHDGSNASQGPDRVR